MMKEDNQNSSNLEQKSTLEVELSPEKNSKYYNMNLMERLNQVKFKMGIIGYDKKAGQGNFAYDYASLPKIEKALKPLAIEFGLFFHTTVENMRVLPNITMDKSFKDYNTKQTVDKFVALDLVVVDVIVSVFDIWNNVEPIVHSVPVFIDTTQKSLTQNGGSSITYARRYGLHIALGLSFEKEDVDYLYYQGEPYEEEVKAAKNTPSANKTTNTTRATTGKQQPVNQQNNANVQPTTSTTSGNGTGATGGGQVANDNIPKIDILDHSISFKDFKTFMCEEKKVIPADKLGTILKNEFKITKGSELTYTMAEVLLKQHNLENDWILYSEKL